MDCSVTARIIDKALLMYHGICDLVAKHLTYLTVVDSLSHDWYLGVRPVVLAVEF